MGCNFVVEEEVDTDWRYRSWLWSLLWRVDRHGGKRARVQGVERAAVKKAAMCGESYVKAEMKSPQTRD